MAWIPKSEAASVGDLFDRLAGILDSLGSVEESLRLALRAPLRPAVARAGEEARRALAEGSSLADGLRRSPDVFREAWVRLVEAGETGGELPRALRRLATRIEHGERTRRRVLESLAYPVFLVHGAVFILYLPTFIGGGGTAYLTRVLATLAILWGGATVAFFAARRARDRGTLGNWPIVGRIVTAFERSGFCFGLGALYESGVTLLPAVEASLPASRRSDPEVLAAIRDLREGGSLTRFLDRSGLLSHESARIVEIAERSGTLGEALEREAGRLEEGARSRLETTATLASRGLGVAAMLVAALSIVRFYASYYSGLMG